MEKNDNLQLEWNIQRFVLLLWIILYVPKSPNCFNDTVTQFLFCLVFFVPFYSCQAASSLCSSHRWLLLFLFFPWSVLPLMSSCPLCILPTLPLVQETVLDTSGIFNWMSVCFWFSWKDKQSGWLILKPPKQPGVGQCAFLRLVEVSHRKDASTAPFLPTKGGRQLFFTTWILCVLVAGENMLWSLSHRFSKLLSAATSFEKCMLVKTHHSEKTPQILCSFL